MSTKVLIPLPYSTNEYGDDVVAIYDPTKLIALAEGIAAMHGNLVDLYERVKGLPISCSANVATRALPEEMIFDEVRDLDREIADVIYESGDEIGELLVIDSARLGVEEEPDDYPRGYFCVEIGEYGDGLILTFTFEWKYSRDKSFSDGFFPAELIAAAEEALAKESEE